MACWCFGEGPENATVASIDAPLHCHVTAPLSLGRPPPAPPPPGRVFRAAAPVHATARDIERIYSDLGVKELIDLRSSDELRMLPQEVGGGI